MSDKGQIRLSFVIGCIAAALDLTFAGDLDLNFADDPLPVNGCIAFCVLSHV